VMVSYWPNSHRQFVGSVMSICILLVAVVSAKAQGGVGSSRGLPESASGIHSISGRIYLPSGRRAGMGIVVKLDGNVSGVRTVTTDADGAFVFNGLPAAEYRLFIDGGSEYEPINQTITIYGNTGNVGLGRAAQTMAIDIHLKLHGTFVDESKVFLGVPKEAVDSYKAAMKSVQSGNSKKAIEQFNDALKIHPAFTQALTDLSVQLLKAGEMEKLAETSESLLKLAPKNGRAHLNLGIALYNLKKFPDAEANLRKAVELNDADPAAHYYLGMTLVSTKHYADAEKELELAIKNGGDNIALAHKYLGGLYISSKKNQQAAEQLERYIQLDPKAPDAERIKGTIKDLRSKQ